MNDTNKSKANKKPARAQAHKETFEPKAKTIKLGIDVHLDRYVVVRILDGGTPQPPQRFGPPEFLLWVAKQLTLAEKVFTCYEAGPFGYSLHRQLERMGVSNYVVRPRDWDEYHKKVKTDKRDAKQLALSLDRYIDGKHGNLRLAAVAALPENTLPPARCRARFATGAAEHGCDEWDLSSTRIWEPTPGLVPLTHALEIHFSANL